jgi:hypothetical protein
MYVRAMRGPFLVVEKPEPAKARLDILASKAELG